MLTCFLTLRVCIRCSSKISKPLYFPVKYVVLHGNSRTSWSPPVLQGKLCATSELEGRFITRSVLKPISEMWYLWCSGRWSRFWSCWRYQPWSLGRPPVCTWNVVFSKSATAVAQLRGFAWSSLGIQPLLCSPRVDSFSFSPLVNNVVVLDCNRLAHWLQWAAAFFYLPFRF